MTARKSSASELPTRVWQRMLSGRRLDLLDPSPLDIEIADIAHGLARVARWNGQTNGAHIFSVAQHTLLVEAVLCEQMPRVDTSFRLAALLHDAPEYVIGDMISPFKAVLGGDYKVVEKRLLAAIHIRFGLPPVLAEEITQKIKAADRGGAYLEATRLAGINVEHNRIIIFLIQGAVAALAGVILASRITSGQPNAAQGFELNVISACVLGGVSLQGGRATISGVAIGVLIMGTAENVMNLLNIDAFYQYLVRGAILLLAVLVDQQKSRGARD